MTATDELRRMLDERGVEWEGTPGVTFWGNCSALDITTNENEKVHLHMCCTPEQAIAATLGGGECEVTSHYYYDEYDLHEFEFSCGHSYTIHDDIPYPFCPICGKKVKAVKR